MEALGESIDLILKYNNYLTNSSFPYTVELNRKKDIEVYLNLRFHSVKGYGGKEEGTLKLLPFPIGRSFNKIDSCFILPAVFSEKLRIE